MSQVIRETFISLHSADILGRLASDFRRRYGKTEGDNQVPLRLFAGQKNSLIKKLKDAGTRLTAHRSQETALQGLSELTTFTDDESMQQEIVEALTQSDSAKEKVEAADEETTNDTQSENGEDGKQKAVKKERKADLVKARFIPLVDLLPPPPVKGTFRVEHIKESQYFFS